MRTLFTFPLLAALCVAAEPQKTTPHLTAEQKLSIREAQVELLSIQQQMQQLQEAGKKAETRLKEAVEAAKKACGGDVTNDLACAEKKEEVKQK